MKKHKKKDLNSSLKQESFLTQLVQVAMSYEAFASGTESLVKVIQFLLNLL